VHVFSHLTGYRRIAVVFWALALTAIAIWSVVPGYVVGWDLQIYENAVHALHAGHDPYVDGIAVQRAFHATLASHPLEPTPYTYVYSPITLPMLGFLGQLPAWLLSAAYWILYIAGAALAIWTGMRAVEADEWPVFALLAPAAIFFPGLVQNDVLFSGNVAYILYGLVLGAAALGWKGKGWGWFYAAVLVASCGKAPMLSLLVIPVVSAKRQWLWAGATGLAGMALFAMQPLLWPAAFAKYLEAVELQFSFNRDFGTSPAGQVANVLYDAIPYRVTSAGFYLIYAIPFFCVLVYLSRRYFDGRFSQKQWIPVVLVGTLLMNPRIMEYDVAPMTIPMALIVWRFLGRGSSAVARIVKACVFFAAINLTAAFPQYLHWRQTETPVLVAAFVAGVWFLLTAPAEDAVGEAVVEGELVPQGA
jgi:hypothetical protein